jgi:hypothetical protein
MIRNSSQINKTSNLPNGVSRFIEIDKRWPGATPIVCFGVLVSIKGKFTIKKFRVSKNVSESQTRKAAIAFRNYYEDCIESGTKFDFNKFDNWKLTS